MKKIKLISILILCFLSLSFLTQAKDKNHSDEKKSFFSFLARKEPVFLMPYSQNNSLNFEYTYDGLRWDIIDNSFFTPKNGILNSPCIKRDKNEIFHLLWTNGKYIYHSTSKDLLTWSEENRLNIKNNKNIKSVQLFNKSKKFKIIWSAENNGKNVIYSASTQDFNTIKDERIICQQNFSIIDPYLIDNNNYHLFFVNENASAQNSNLFMTTSRSLKKLGQKEIKPMPTKGIIKNPVAIKIRDYIYVYWNNITKKSIISLRCENLSNPIWTNVTDFSSFPKQIDLNSIFKIKSKLLYNIQEVSNKNP